MSEQTPPIPTQLYTDAATGELKERQYKVVVSAGPDQGKETLLESGTIMIGSHANNDFVLSDDTVSRYHIELQVRRDGLQVRDLDSTNGTFHGETRLGSISVHGASRLRLGKKTVLDIIPVDSAVELNTWSGEDLAGVVGRSPVMGRLFSLLSRVAPTDATLLLEGETGTGKEAIADAVHRMSNRASGPFVVVDCAAIPTNLIGSELFGHVRGAFTGAHTDKQGLIEAADGGTLFLDEIGELSIDLQPQLLRALEKREVRRIGDTRSTTVDIRVLAATNRDLRAMVREGTFREDLYYRLAVVRAVVPPLRERADDVPLLAMHFAQQMGSQFDLSPSLIEALKQHPWPGNVRELRNVVERALSLRDLGGAAGPDPAQLVSNVANAPSQAAVTPVPGAPSREEVLEMPFKEAKNKLIEAFERDYLEHLLDRHKGNISRAANEAGIDRNYIHRLVKKYNITVERG